MTALPEALRAWAEKELSPKLFSQDVAHDGNYYGNTGTGIENRRHLLARLEAFATEWQEKNPSCEHVGSVETLVRARIMPSIEALTVERDALKVERDEYRNIGEIAGQVAINAQELVNYLEAQLAAGEAARAALREALANAQGWVPEGHLYDEIEKLLAAS